MPGKPPPRFALPESAAHLTYRVVRPWARWGVSLFHRIDRSVEGAEHLSNPEGKDPARLLFSGHQNGLADPILACVLLPPQIHFFTRGDVFRHPLARALLLRLNMMPIFRPKDRLDDMADRNRATFSAAHSRLENGATCGIFPRPGTGRNGELEGSDTAQPVSSRAPCSASPFGSGGWKSYPCIWTSSVTKVTAPGRASL